MSKSKREKNFKNEERKFTDGYKKSNDYVAHKYEKRLRNAIRGNAVDLITDEYDYIYDR